MTTNELKLKIAAILTTALETEPGSFPESLAYLALGGNIHEWNGIRDLMIDSGMIAVEGHAIKLTDAGRTLARKIDSIQKNAKKAREDAATTHHPRDFEAYREECKARFAQIPPQ